eukprot:IDg10669t1
MSQKRDALMGVLCLVLPRKEDFIALKQENEDKTSLKLTYTSKLSLSGRF